MNRKNYNKTTELEKKELLMELGEIRLYINDIKCISFYQKSKGKYKGKVTLRSAEPLPASRPLLIQPTPFDHLIRKTLREKRKREREERKKFSTVYIT